MRLSGKISDKLRRLFGPDDAAWHPERPASPTKQTKAPRDVDGHRMTGRHRRDKS